MEHWNQKVAAARGKKWRSSILAGRLEVSRNPTHLRLARVKQSKNQTDVAKELGLTYATYGAIENGHRPVTSERAKQISTYLGVPMKRAFENVRDDNPKMEGKMIARKDTDGN